MHTSHPLEKVQPYLRLRAFDGVSRLLPLGLALVIGLLFAYSGHAQSADDPESIVAYQAQKESATQTFLDPEMPKEVRMKAAADLGYPEDETFAALLRIGSDPAADDEIRWEAFRLHRFDEDYLNAVLDLLETPKNGGGKLVGDLVENLSRRMTTQLPATWEQRIRAALRNLLDDPRERVRLSAYRVLIGGHDTLAVDRLVEALNRGEEDVPIPLAEAIILLDTNGSIYHIRTLQPYLDHADPNVQAQAVRALAVDPSSRPRIIDLTVVQTTPEEVRLNALRALSREDAAFADYAIDLIADGSESSTIRLAAMKSFVGRMNYREVDESDQIRFAQTVKAMADEIVLKGESGETLRQEAAKLFAYLNNVFPAIKRYYALRAHS